MSRKQKYDAFGFSTSELKQMQGVFGGSSKKGQGLPDLQINLFDVRPAKVKYREAKKRVDERLENLRYNRKLETLRQAEAKLEREHPTSIVGYAKKGGRMLFNQIKKRR